jgi:hypothetical protein
MKEATDWKILNIPKPLFERLEDIKWNINSKNKMNKIEKRVSYGEILEKILDEYDRNPSILDNLIYEI